MIRFLNRLGDVTFKVFFFGFAIIWLIESRRGVFYLGIFLAAVISILMSEYVVWQFRRTDEQSTSETK